MQPRPEDHLSQNTPKSGPRWGLIIGAAVIVGLILAFFVPRNTEPPSLALTEPETSAAAEPELPPAPDIPERQTASQPPAEPNAVDVSSSTEAPLTLETGDAELRARLAGAGDSTLLEEALGSDNLLERSVSLLDGFSRGVVLYKVLPIAPPSGEFAVMESGDQVLMDPANYQRYDAQVSAIEALDTATVVDIFHRFRPLLEATYAGLGQKPEEFDNALIRTLDRILATPRIDEPIELVRHVASYRYADPELERKSGLQKQLLRMGPDNIARLQAQALALRNALLEE